MLCFYIFIYHFEKFLMSSDCFDQSKFGYTPVQIALVLGHDDIWHLFLTHPKLDWTLMWDLPWSYLSSTLERTYVPIMRLLLKHFKMQTNQFYLFMRAAYVSNHVELIRTFIGDPTLTPYIDSYDMLYEKTCV